MAESVSQRKMWDPAQDNRGLEGAVAVAGISRQFTPVVGGAVNSSPDGCVGIAGSV
jgi:hypothetical protein